MTIIIISIILGIIALALTTHLEEVLRVADAITSEPAFAEYEVEAIAEAHVQSLIAKGQLEVEISFN